jgi:hypothetical protein
MWCTLLAVELIWGFPSSSFFVFILSLRSAKGLWIEDPFFEIHERILDRGSFLWDQWKDSGSRILSLISTKGFWIEDPFFEINKRKDLDRGSFLWDQWKDSGLRIFSLRSTKGFWIEDPFIEIHGRILDRFYVSRFSTVALTLHE